MKAKEYWSTPNAGKRERLLIIPFSILYAILVCVAYLIDPEELLGIFIMIIIGVWYGSKGIRESFRMVSHPVCRLTDEFVISDYDRNVVPWDCVTRIVTDTRKRVAKIYHSTGEDPITHEPSEGYVRINGKWMQNWDSFLRDLGVECEKRSVRFTVKT